MLDLDPAPVPTVWLAPRHEDAAARLVPDGGPVLALGPAANWIGKQWRAERFAELADRLTGDGGALAGARVAGQADFYRKVWALGAAGIEVPLTVLTREGVQEVTVISADRYDHLKLKPSY